MSDIHQALKQSQHRLDLAQIPGGRLDSELLMAYVFGRDRTWVLAHDDIELDVTQLEQFDSLINRRLNREPLVHITGSREFYGLEFEITPHVLTPRIETEQMVEWALSHAPKDSALIDIGTGSGAIAVAIASRRSDLQVTATDLSERELTVARSNASRHNTTIAFIASDLWSQVPGRFKTIVTNLPYLKDDADLMPEVTREPAVALHGGPDGLDLYRRLLAGIPDHLEPGGYLFTECDPWQHDALVTAAGKYGLMVIEQGYFIIGFQLA